MRNRTSKAGKGEINRDKQNYEEQVWGMGWQHRDMFEWSDVFSRQMFSCLLNKGTTEVVW